MYFFGVIDECDILSISGEGEGGGPQGNWNLNRKFFGEDLTAQQSLQLTSAPKDGDQASQAAGVFVFIRSRHYSRDLCSVTISVDGVWKLYA